VHSIGARGATHGDNDTGPEIGRVVVSTRAVLAASATVVGPFSLAAAITAVAMAWPAPVQADPGSSLLNDLGVGPVTTAVGQLASGFCPLIQKPDGTPAGEPVGSECATFMTSLFNGNFTALTNAPAIFGTSPPAATPLSIPGLTSSAPVTNPLAVPGL
jgi:hypothetical protein